MIVLKVIGLSNEESNEVLFANDSNEFIDWFIARLRSDIKVLSYLNTQCRIY